MEHSLPSYNCRFFVGSFCQLNKCGDYCSCCLAGVERPLTQSTVVISTDLQFATFTMKFLSEKCTNLPVEEDLELL